MDNATEDDAMQPYFGYANEHIKFSYALNVPGVYALFDEYDNLLYIGKSHHLSFRIAEHLGGISQLKNYQWKRIKKVMYHECENTLDAGIIETALIAYYKPPYNVQGKIGMPTVISVEDIIGGLDWKCCYNEQRYISDEKTKLIKRLRAYDDMHLESKVLFFEETYEKYVLQHEDDSEDEKEENKDLFRAVLVRAMGQYDNMHDRRTVCSVIKNSYLPDIGIEWFMFCRHRMNHDGYATYGDIDRAFAENRHISRGLAEMLAERRWVHPLSEYDFGSLEIPDIERIPEKKNVI